MGKRRHFASRTYKNRIINFRACAWRLRQPGGTFSRRVSSTREEKEEEV